MAEMAVAVEQAAAAVMVEMAAPSGLPAQSVRLRRPSRFRSTIWVARLVQGVLAVQVEMQAHREEPVGSRRAARRQKLATAAVPALREHRAVTVRKQATAAPSIWLN
ncbi:hypothetical protein [Mesorhizobium sp. Z1-4]|uniref:hypothetical protein n=1 Tax=Mesorhizobium sp. Z1-4 TaxID=2448478 RepID=UPI0013DE7EFC|nr:hypothetical protein [Mesorhizobium sp. Z1-4]